MQQSGTHTQVYDRHKHRHDDQNACFVARTNACAWESLMLAPKRSCHLLLVPDEIGLHAALRLETIPQLISWVHSLVKVSRQIEGHKRLWIALNCRHQSGL